MSRTNTATARRPVNSNPFAEPDVLTPHQFFKVFRQKGHMDPEEKLMFAVLTDAVECFQKHIGAIPFGRFRSSKFAACSTSVRVIFGLACSVGAWRANATAAGAGAFANRCVINIG
jgi:hypothetical protein